MIVVFICLPSDRQARAAAMVHKHGREELPHVRGQGQRPRVPGFNEAGTAERSYPTSEVRGGGLEELPRVRGQGRWQRVPGCDSSGAAKRSYPTSKVRGGGREESPPAGGATLPPRSSGCVGLEELLHIQDRERGR